MSVSFLSGMLGNLIPTANGRFTLPSTKYRESRMLMIKLRTLGYSQSKTFKKRLRLEKKDRVGDKERRYKNTRTYLRTMLSASRQISLGHPYTLTLMLGRSHTMEPEDQEVSIGKELNLCHENSSISHFLKPVLLSHEVSLLNCGAKFDPSCHGFGMLDDVSFVDPNVFGSKLVNFTYHHPLKEVMFQTNDLLGLFLKFIKETSFCYHFLFKDVSLNPFEEFSKKLFLSNFISNVLLKDFEGTLLMWKLELLPNFMFLILQSLENLSFQFHWLFKDIVENAVNMCHLQYFYAFTSAFLGRSLVIFTCFFHSPLSHLVFNFFDYNSFAYHRPIKEF
ncbi:hypothetical protein M9H77_18833 [Catharanthus roseus]|uniref:Uncharacterized protein n=1 Tax=Catharanthus roseus TaxID=4058 RepID=A0ACC0B8N7_CATRO|nr:hypothetical protein M9H77_18833 [Catharanthus roseus]